MDLKNEYKSDIEDNEEENDYDYENVDYEDASNQESSGNEEENTHETLNEYSLKNMEKDEAFITNYNKINTNQNSKLMARQKKRVLGKFFTSQNDFDDCFKKFNDFKDVFFHKWKNEKNYIHQKVIDIFEFYKHNNEADSLIDISNSEIDNTSMDLKIDSTKDKESYILRLMYIFTNIIFELEEEYFTLFVSQKKPYEKLREDYVNFTIKQKEEFHFINLEELKKKLNERIGYDESNSDYYYSLMYKMNSEIKIKDIEELEELSIKQLKEGKSISEKRESEALGAFLKGFSTNDCLDILTDTYNAIDFIEKSVESCLELFSDLIFVYNKKCEIKLDQFSKVFVDEFLEIIKQDPFYKVSYCF